MKCLEADYISEIWMNERSIWALIRLNKLINTAHTWMNGYNCHMFSFNLIFSRPQDTFWRDKSFSLNSCYTRIYGAVLFL